MSDTQVIISIAIIALVTAALRFLPFIVFGGKRKPPAIVVKLGGALPYAVMGMLVVYCLKDVAFSSLGSFMPELIACALIVVLHLWRRNTLLSIIVGTVSYMLMTQLVF